MSRTFTSSTCCDAREYVWLAEQASGPIPEPASFAYVWGEALAELKRRAPDVRVVNLETSITRNANPWRGKDVHYRMHPANLACLSDARIDVCAVANNHMLDYGRAGRGRQIRAVSSRAARWCANQTPARSATCSSVPGSSNR